MTHTSKEMHLVLSSLILSCINHQYHDEEKLNNDNNCEYSESFLHILNEISN